MSPHLTSTPSPQFILSSQTLSEPGLGLGDLADLPIPVGSSMANTIPMVVSSRDRETHQKCMTDDTVRALHKKPALPHIANDMSLGDGSYFTMRITR